MAENLTDDVSMYKLTKNQEPEHFFKKEDC